MRCLKICLTLVIRVWKSQRLVFPECRKVRNAKKNKLKQALKKLEANQKKQEKEYYVERVNERKEFIWQLLKQLGYSFDDICIIGGSLALLREKIDSGNATDEINACIAKYSELIKEKESADDEALDNEAEVDDADEVNDTDACIDTSLDRIDQ